MFQNNDRETLRELASENYKSHRARNVTAVLAIFLTTFLLTSAFTAGTGFLSTSLNAGEQTPGPMSDGYISGGERELHKLDKLPEIEWADLVLPASSAPLHNNVFGGVDTRVDDTIAELIENLTHRLSPAHLWQLKPPIRQLGNSLFTGRAQFCYIQFTLRDYHRKR